MTESDDIRRFAERYPKIARAAREGYSVAASVLDELAGELAKEFPDAATILVRAHAPARDLDWSERESPRPEVLKLRDRVLARVASMEWPASVRAEVSRVMRVEERDPESKTKEKFTAIIVSINCTSVATRFVIVRAE